MKANKTVRNAIPNVGSALGSRTIVPSVRVPIGNFLLPPALALLDFSSPTPQWSIVSPARRPVLPAPALPAAVPLVWVRTGTSHQVIAGASLAISTTALTQTASNAIPISA